MERHLRAAWRQWDAAERGGRAKIKQLTDPSYAFDPAKQAHINALEFAKTLITEMSRHKIKSNRARMLRYELQKFIQEGVSDGE